jgi:hypothetical protein
MRMPCHVARESAKTPALEFSLAQSALANQRGSNTYLSTRRMVYNGRVHLHDLLSREMKHKNGGSKLSRPACTYQRAPSSIALRLRIQLVS